MANLCRTTRRSMLIDIKLEEMSGTGDSELRREASPLGGGTTVGKVWKHVWNWRKETDSKWNATKGFRFDDTTNKRSFLNRRVTKWKQPLRNSRQAVAKIYSLYHRYLLRTHRRQALKIQVWTSRHPSCTVLKDRSTAAGRGGGDQHPVWGQWLFQPGK